MKYIQIFFKKTNIYLLCMCVHSFAISNEDSCQRHLKGAQARVLVSVLNKKPTLSLKQTVAVSAGHIGGEDGMAVLEQLAVQKPTNLELQITIIESAAKIGGNRSIQIIEQIFNQDPQNLKIQQTVISAVEKIGEEGGVLLLEKLLAQKPTNPIIQVNIIESATKIGGERSVKVIKQIFNQNPNSLEVQKAVAVSAGHIEREDGIQFLNQLLTKKDIKVQFIGQTEEGKILLEQTSNQNPDRWRVQKAIAVSAGQIGGEDGAKVLEQLSIQTPLNLEVQIAIIKSAMKIDGKKSIQIIEQIFNQNPKSLDIQTNIAFLAQYKGEDGLKLLQLLNKAKIHPEVRNWIVHSAGEIDSAGRVELIKNVLNQAKKARKKIPDSLLTKVILSILRLPTQKEQMEIIQYLNLQQFSRPLHIILTLVVMKRGDIELFKAVIHQYPKLIKNTVIQHIVAVNAGNMGEEGVEFLQILLSQKTLSNERQQNIAESAEKIGGPSGVKILQQLMNRNPTNFKVQKAIVDSAVKIGGAEGIETLQQFLSQNPTNKLKQLIAESIILIEENV